MTNPTKGQTPTAEELLKEAAEFINNLIDGDKMHWQTPEAERALKLRSGINTHLSSPPYPLGSSRELLQESARLLKYWIELDSNGLVEHRKDLVLTYKQINNFLFQSQEPSPASVPPALTWEQAKQKVAKDNGHETWFLMIEDFAHYREIGAIETAEEEAAHLFMEANRLQRWIPVEERLPPTGQQILFATKKHVYRGSYVEVFGSKEFVDSAICCVGVVAWQPLPEVPK